MTPWREPFRRVPWVMGAVLLLFTAVVALDAAPANAEPAPPTPDPVTISLDRVSPEVLDDDDELTLAGTITNDGDSSLSDVTVWWRMRTQVLGTDDVTRWFDEENDTKPLTLARHDLEVEIEPGSSESYKMVIGAESSPFDYGSAPGPRGIELVVTATDEDGASLRDHIRSTIIWYPKEAASSAPLTIAVPLTPTEPEWMDALEAGTSVSEVSAARIGAVVKQFDDHEVTWGVDASVLDSVPAGQLGRSLLPDEAAPEENSEENSGDDDLALAWEESAQAGELGELLADTRRSVVSLGWAAPDLGSLSQAGIDGDRFRERNTDYAHEVLGEAGLDPVPDVVWSLSTLAPGSVSRFDARTTTVVVPPTPTGAQFVPPTARHVTVRSPQAELVELFLDDVDPSELRARTAAYAEERTSLLVTLPPDLDEDQAQQVAHNLDVLNSAPWVDLSPLDSPSASGTVPGASVANPSALSTTDISELTQALARADSFARLTDAPQQVNTIFNSAAFLASSSVWANESAVPRELLADVTTAAHTEFLTIEQPSMVNLISQGGDLPVSVENSSPIALHPVVEMKPGDARLLADEAVHATLEPEQTTTVTVPITAVANGNVSATIRLLDTDGNDVATSQTFTVRVRADWETTGTAVFAGVVAVGFLFGLIRNIRSASGRHGRGKNG